MKPGLQPGVRAELEAEVTPDMVATFEGEMIHPVYSTCSMVLHMEQAARKLVMPFLEEHEDGFGTRICVNHVSPARVGRTVRVVAECVEVVDKKVVCRVTAYHGRRVLGEGEQVQTILPRHAIEKVIERS